MAATASQSRARQLRRDGCGGPEQVLECARTRRFLDGVRNDEEKSPKFRGSVVARQATTVNEVSGRRLVGQTGSFIGSTASHLGSRFRQQIRQQWTGDKQAPGRTLARSSRRATSWVGPPASLFNVSELQHRRERWTVGRPVERASHASPEPSQIPAGWARRPSPLRPTARFDFAPSSQRRGVRWSSSALFMPRGAPATNTGDAVCFQSSTARDRSSAG